MTVEFLAEKATWSANADGTFLCIPAASPAKVLEALTPGKEYVCEIKRKTRKRSLDANAYYWKLCGELAKAMDLPAVDVYRQHIAGLSNYAVYGMPEEAVPMFEQLWTSGHLGRFIETRAARTEGIVNVVAYYGSSDFDTVQMSRLIDHCIQDCEALGIETKPREEVEALLSQWHETRNDIHQD